MRKSLPVYPTLISTILLLLACPAPAQAVGGSFDQLHRWDGEAIYDYLGRSVSGAGDVNGEGFDDVVVGSYWANSVMAYGFHPFVTATDDKISIATGDAIDFQIDFPDRAAGYSYKLLASQSGTGPTYYGVQIPLTHDSLVQRSLMGTYPRVLEGNHQGALDAEGNAVARIRLTAGNWPELIGMQYYIAMVAIAATGLPKYSSVAVPVTIVP